MSLGTVLLVDDDARVASALRRELQASEYDVVVASDVFSAIDLLRCSNIDVIISDEQMPGSCGADLMVFARSRFPGVARIILSGKGCAASRARATREGGVFRYLDKPCPAEVVLEAIRLALEARRGSHRRSSPPVGP